MGVRVINPVQQTVPPMMIPQRAQPNFEAYGPLGAGVASAGQSIGEGLIAGIEARRRQEEHRDMMAFRREQLAEERSGLHEQLANALEVAKVQAAGPERAALLSGFFGLLGTIKAKEIDQAISNTDIAAKEAMHGEDIDTALLNMASGFLRDAAASNEDKRRYQQTGRAGAKASFLAQYILGKDARLKELRLLDPKAAFHEAMSIWGNRGYWGSPFVAGGVLGTLAGTEIEFDPKFESDVLRLWNSIESSSDPPDVQMAQKLDLWNEFRAVRNEMQKEMWPLSRGEALKQATLLLDKLAVKLGMPKTGDNLFSKVNVDKMADDAAWKLYPELADETDSLTKVSKAFTDIRTAMGARQAAKAGHPEVFTDDFKAILDTWPDLRAELIQSGALETGDIRKMATAVDKVLNPRARVREEKYTQDRTAPPPASVIPPPAPSPPKPLWGGDQMFLEPSKRPWESNPLQFLETPQQSGVMTWESGR